MSRVHWPDRSTAAAAIRRLGESLGRTPNGRDMDWFAKERLCPCAWTCFRLFGSLRDAQVAAGLTPNGRGSARRWTRALAIAELQRRARQLGHTPTVAELHQPAWSTLRDLFGSYRAAQLAAGLVPNEVGQRRGVSRRGTRAHALNESLVARLHSHAELRKYWGMAS